MEYLIHFAQVHESFRQPELQALATMAGVDLEIISYNQYSPYCLVKLPDEASARALIARSILAKDIVEIWGRGTTYDEVHADVRRRTEHRWEDYSEKSFRFTIESFAQHRSAEEKNEIIKSFAYLGFNGPTRMKDPDVNFCVLEEYMWDVEAVETGLTPSSKTPSIPQEPLGIYFGRWVAHGSRELATKYDLKKRSYISTTSMDAELSLITANLACAGPGKLFYDPFVGTGGFCVAAANFGALTFGSDIDGRSYKGKEMAQGKPMGLLSNFRQYGLVSKFVDAFTSDLTNTPVRSCQFLDGVVCDPPYGVREGLRVLGSRDGRPKEYLMIDGVPSFFLPGYVPPKKPYGFEAMLNDILSFAATHLVANGRLSMWMPTASDEEVELMIPMHPSLEVVSVAVQHFNNWARRLITYRRLPEGEVSDVALGRRKGDAQGLRADDLNEFRRKYFTKTEETKSKRSKAREQKRREASQDDQGGE